MSCAAGLPGFVILLFMAGCTQPSNDSIATVQPASVDRATPFPAPDLPSRAEITGDTDQDRAFGKIVELHSEGMIARASIGLERLGLLRLVLDRSASPEQVLGMTRKLLRAARKDYPERPISLALFDPGEEPILKARFRPGHGVRYEVVHRKPGEVQPGGEPSTIETPGHDVASISTSGETDKDRIFAAWAAKQGGPRLRYVEANVERNGRLWIGLASDANPAELVKMIFDKAQDEFQREDLVAMAFDTEGRPVGKARVVSGGVIDWSDEPLDTRHEQ